MAEAGSQSVNREQALAMYQVIREANPFLPAPEFAMDDMQLEHDAGVGTFISLRLPVQLPEDWWERLSQILGRDLTEGF